MAIEVLKAIAREQSIQQEVRHDVESFVWVLCYVLARRLVYQTLPSKIKSTHKLKGSTAELDKELKTALEDFHSNFGRGRLTSILTSRNSLEAISKLIERPYAIRHLPDATRSLLIAIEDMMKHHTMRLKPIYLSYESLGQVLDAAIVELGTVANLV